MKLGGQSGDVGYRKSSNRGKICSKHYMHIKNSETIKKENQYNRN